MRRKDLERDVLMVRLEWALTRQQRLRDRLVASGQLRQAIAAAELRRRTRRD